MVPHSREEIRSFILGHPVFQRWHQLASTSAQVLTSAFERNPWLALGEQLFMAGEVLYYEEAQDSLPLDVRITLAETIIHAQTYFWQEKPLFTAKEMPVPRHTFSARSLPYSSMFWSFPSDRVATDEYHWSRGFLLMQMGDALHIWFNLYKEPQGSPTLAIQILKGGSIFPDAFQETPAFLIGATYICQLLAFLNSPYIVKTESQPDRSTRRAVARNLTYADNPRGVTVVTLRSPTIVKEESDRKSEETRTWLHQWWVRGHIRAQWYPSRQGHQLMWIAPHLKGPDGLPILVKTYSVSR